MGFLYIFIPWFLIPYLISYMLTNDIDTHRYNLTTKVNPMFNIGSTLKVGGGSVPVREQWVKYIPIHTAVQTPYTGLTASELVSWYSDSGNKSQRLVIIIMNH